MGDMASFRDRLRRMMHIRAMFGSLRYRILPLVSATQRLYDLLIEFG
jgi:hypothetical protein